MPKHILRLIVLIFGLLVVAVIGKELLTDKSFYRFGHYRADSVPEIAAQIPVLQTAASCQECHAERFEKWSVAKHKTVTCENCHGAALGHPQKIAKLPIPTDAVKLCTRCHEALTGRPDTQPQVEVPKHNKGRQCVACHNPHVPEE